MCMYVYSMITTTHYLRFILEKVRFYEPTRYESQLYEQILKKIAAFRARITSKNGIGRLSNVLQKNVVVSKPKLVEHQINTELEYRSLERNYESLLNSGYPNSTFSGEANCDVESIKFVGLNFVHRSLSVSYHRIR